MGKIRTELMTAAKIAPKRGESDTDFLIRLQNAISNDIDDGTWNGLSTDAQDWNNDAADAINARKPIALFKDEEAAPAAAPATGGRRRGAAAEPPPEAENDYEPVEGDKVRVVTERGKETIGIVVEVGGDGIMITNPNGKDGEEKDDSEHDLEKVTVTKFEEPAPTGRRGRGAAATEPAAAPEKKTPEVGDTVEAITARDKVIVGNVIEISGDDLVLVDSTGADHELSIGKLKSLVVKVDNNRKDGAGTAAAEPAAGGRRRGAGAAGAPEAGGDKPKRASNDTSVGHRIREIVCGDPSLTQDKVEAILKKEKFEFRETTVKMIMKDTKTVIDLLKK